MWNSILLFTLLIGGLGMAIHDAIKDRSPRDPVLRRRIYTFENFWTQKRTKKERLRYRIEKYERR